ncbi:MAG: hypothetical protein U0168_04975 [Nannocystaceae bacterium]|jgi:hypothetical protein
MMLRALSLLLGAALACSVEGGGGDDGFGASCTPNTVVACTCPDQSASTLQCDANGIPGACMCAAATEGSSGGGGSSDGSGGGSGGSDDSGTAADGSSGSGGCDGIYAGKVDGIGVPWVYQGQMGLQGGNAACASIGADHVCEYAEVRMAQDAGELDGLINTSAWIHRETIESIDGVPSAPGPGGRCVDWTDGSGMFADGEWVDFGVADIIYHLDPDTFYDGLDSSHTDPVERPCAMVLRAVLCCNAAC